MTPEEILKDLIKGTFKPYQHDLADLATNKAIEAIKQYAREMCDKQKDECTMAVSVHGNEDIELFCENAPYPKELL